MFLNNLFLVLCSNHKTHLSGHQVSTKILSLRFTGQEFKTSGSVSFFNPKLPESLEVVDPNGLSLESRQIRVGLGTTVNHDSDVPHPLQVGNTVKQLFNGAQGTLVALQDRLLQIFHSQMLVLVLHHHRVVSLILVLHLRKSLVKVLMPTADITINGGVRK